MGSLRSLLVLLLVHVFFLGELTVSGGREPDIETTREEILESRRRRSKQLEAMLAEAKQRLTDHSAGIRLLDEKEKTDLEKKADIYARKLDTMKGDLDEREIERIIKREQLRNERRRERRERRDEF